MAASFTDSFNVAQAAAMCLAEARRSSQIRLPLVPSNCSSAEGTCAPPAWRTLPDEFSQVLGRSSGAASMGDADAPNACHTPEEPNQSLGGSSSLTGGSPAWHLQPEEPDQAVDSAPSAERRRRLRSRATREPLVHHAAVQGHKDPSEGASAGTRVALGGTLSQDEQRVLVALMMLRSVY